MARIFADGTMNCALILQLAKGYSSMRSKGKKPMLIGGLTIVFSFGWFLWHLLGFSPPIDVSKETTFIVAPLRADGLPDYEKYVLEKYREGVTPENNAAVLFWQAMGPVEMEPKDLALVSMAIGLNPIPNRDECLTDILGSDVKREVETWLLDGNFTVDTDDSVTASADDVKNKFIKQVIDRPWTSEQIPPLGAWLAANQKPLNLLLDAAQRAKFFSPSVELMNGLHEPLLVMTLPWAPASRTAAHGLAARAMWLVARRRNTDAWRDILAIYRLSRLIGEDRTLVEQIVSINLELIADRATVALLESRNTSAELAEKIHADLESLGMRHSMADTLDGIERVAILSALLSLRDGNDYLRISQLDRWWFKAVDWNIPLRKLNAHFDELSAAADLSDWDARKNALDVHEQQLKRIEVSIAGRKAAGGLKTWNVVRSEIVGDIFVTLMLPATNVACDAQDRANTHRALTELAAALAIYRSNHGIYPESLEQLVPGVLDKLLTDLYHDRPFAYRRTNAGYLLYSLGPNGQDDGGNNAKEPQSNDIPADADDDDDAIRLPLPKLELPKAK